MTRSGSARPAFFPFAAAAMLLAALSIAIGSPAGAQDRNCRCAGLGAVDLSATHSRNGGGTPLDYRPAGAAGAPVVTATIRLSCRANGENRHCSAEVDATITENGASSIGSGSGTTSAPVDACLIVGKALAAAWQEAVDPGLAVQAPGPCS